MNVIVLNDFAHINGGASQVALTEAVALAQAGHSVSFFAAVGPVAPILSENCATVIDLGQQELVKEKSFARAALRGIWNFGAAQRLVELLSRHDPADTIVHLHSWTKALSPSVVRAVLDRNFRMVCTLHDYFTACPNGGFYDYRTNEICKLRPLSPACMVRHCDRRSYAEKLWRVARQAISARFARLPAGIHGFFYSTDLSLEILKPYLPADACFLQVKNPIDVPRADPADPGSNKGFIGVGRIVPEKGFDLLAKAARAINAPVTFVGDGESRESIQAEAPNAEFTGWLGRADVLSRIRRSRALVLPSRWYETQGMVVLEAASQGIPALVPDSSTARESVEDGVTGFRFEGGNWQSLADKMRKLEDDEVARRLGQAAYERYWSNPATSSGHAQELIAGYRAVLDRAA